MIADQGIAWWGHEGDDARHQLGAGHHTVGTAVATILGAVGVPAVGEALETLERDGRAGAVADEALASAVVPLFDVHARVEVEAILGACMTAVTALGRKARLLVIGRCGASEADERAVA